MLTKEQQKIVKHNVFGAAYLFVMAGPGTGKTHVLCHRVRHLIKKGVTPENILRLTYSKSAALNMASRLAKRFNVWNVRYSTTHAFGLSLVMEHWHELGFTARPKVKTKSSFKRLSFIVKKMAAQDHVDQKQLQIAVYKALKEGRATVLKVSVNQVLERYQQGKLRNNWLDFADMLKLACQLLKDYPDILKSVGTIEHLLVDEVQDMTEKECQLLYYLAKAAKSAVLVGDEKQNIYSFRGAHPESLQKLESYLKPQTRYLTQSFRVPKQLLPMVNSIGADICDAPELTSQKKGFKPALFCAANNDEQSDFIAKQIKKR